jgi:prepilin-type N-terminal cleavage/methylation domain-containing protein
MSKLTKISQKNNQSGFTIIEVVLSLAIGAMIIGMVFIALPNLQKQRRDTARKNDLGKVLSQLEAFAGNNNGRYPTNQAELDAFSTAYVTNNGAIFEDPTSGPYTLTFFGAPGAPTAPSAVRGAVSYYTGSQCVNELVGPANGLRNIAVAIPLERGMACQGNQ